MWKLWTKIVQEMAIFMHFYPFLAIFAAWCAVWCAVIWSFPFIWTMCDTRTYHWFDSRRSKKFFRSCISPTVQFLRAMICSMSKRKKKENKEEIDDEEVKLKHKKEKDDWCLSSDSRLDLLFAKYDFLSSCYDNH